MRQLVAAGNHVSPGGSPHIDTLSYGGREMDAVTGPEDHHDQDEADGRAEKLFPGHAVEDEEQRADDQRRAVVLDADEYQDGHAHTGSDGHDVIEARNVEVGGEGSALLPEVAKDVPVLGEIPGQEEDDQDAHHLDGLEEEEIHLGVTAAGAGTKSGQRQTEECSGGDEDVSVAAKIARVVGQAEGGHDDGAAQDPLHEVAEHQGVAQRVAEADHQDEADAAKHFDGGQNQVVAGELGVAPEDVEREEADVEDGDPENHAGTPGRWGTHDQERFQIADLGSGKEWDIMSGVRDTQAGDGSDVGDGSLMGEFEDPAGRGLAHSGVGDLV